MIFSSLVNPNSGRSGRLLATVMVTGGVLLALIALKFRVFTPAHEPLPPATAQTSPDADESPSPATQP